jgi:hypothetical protein
LVTDRSWTLALPPVEPAVEELLRPQDHASTSNSLFMSGILVAFVSPGRPGISGYMLSAALATTGVANVSAAPGLLQ